MDVYTLTRESLNSISDLEIAFGTTKLLPDYEQVPASFKEDSGGNIYTKLLDNMFADRPLPNGEVVFRPGFEDPEVPNLLSRVVRAHMQSFEPKHQHKIAGLGYLISLVCEIRE